MSDQTLRLSFGGGCHWCTEAVFQALRGVARVEQGFIASAPPNDSYSEAVIVHFAAQELPLDVLIEVHLRTHASSSRHAMRGKYRSAVYGFDTTQLNAAESALARLQAGFDAPLVTKVLPFVAFKPSDTRFQNYYHNDPERPFCQTYIEPKLRLLTERFAANVQSGLPRSLTPASPT